MAEVNYEIDEEILELLSKPWQRFFRQFSEIETLPHSKWKPVHLIAQFAKRYKQHYGKKFSFSMRSCPSKSSEVFLIKKITAMLGTTNNKIISNYIDWVFDNKLSKTNKKIRSIGFLANAQFCNEFQLQLADMQKFNRASELPSDYLIVVKNMDLPIETWGDLAFAKQIVDSASNEKETYAKLFHELYKVGFEFDMLKELK